jgi:hypothetical protein
VSKSTTGACFFLGEKRRTLMKREIYFNFIVQKLAELSTSIEVLGSLNLLDKHLHSEDFYKNFINLLFSWELKNINAVQKNAPGIDLIDTTKRIIAQVSSTATKPKIEEALAKDLSSYKGYSFKFISISKDAEKLRTKTFANPHGLVFMPANDIFDITSLLALIKGLDMDRLEEIFTFIKKELVSEPDPIKTESNLATIINILSRLDWSERTDGFETVPYDIDAKISHNQLVSAKTLISEHKVHYGRIDKIYSEFDEQGANKSLSILSGIRAEYFATRSEGTPDEIFFAIIKKIAGKIQHSANYTPIPDEELELCVGILVVDAFIRCKIFENPVGYIDAHS